MRVRRSDDLVAVDIVTFWFSDGSQLVIAFRLLIVLEFYACLFYCLKSKPKLRYKEIRHNIQSKKTNEEQET